jgi:hypothetical protein
VLAWNSLELNINKLDPLPRLSLRRQLRIQFDVNSTMIFGFDEAMISLERTFGDKNTLSFPHPIALGLRQSSALDTGHRYIIHVNVDLEVS